MLLLGSAVHVTPRSVEGPDAIALSCPPPTLAPTGGPGVADVAVPGEEHTAGLTCELVPPPPRHPPPLQDQVSLMWRCLEKNSLRDCAVQHFTSAQQVVKGLYAAFLPDWLKVYPRDQVGLGFRARV